MMRSLTLPLKLGRFALFHILHLKRGFIPNISLYCTISNLQFSLISYYLSPMLDLHAHREREIAKCWDALRRLHRLRWDLSFLGQPSSCVRWQRLRGLWCRRRSCSERQRRGHVPHLNSDMWPDLPVLAKEHSS